MGNCQGMQFHIIIWTFSIGCLDRITTSHRSDATVILLHSTFWECSLLRSLTPTRCLMFIWLTFGVQCIHSPDDLSLRYWQLIELCAVFRLCLVSNYTAYWCIGEQLAPSCLTIIAISVSLFHCMNLQSSCVRGWIVAEFFSAIDVHSQATEENYYSTDQIRMALFWS